MTGASARRSIGVRPSPTPTEAARKRAVERLTGAFVGLVLLVHLAGGLGRALRPEKAVVVPEPLVVDVAHDPPERLVFLPGIGPVRAAAIVADRERLGPVSSFADLTRIWGIGPHTVERIRDAREVRAVVDGEAHAPPAPRR